MKSLYLLLISCFLCSAAFCQTEQAEYDPLDFWEGKWTLKTTSVDPEPEDDTWKTENGVNEFVRILDGNGLHRISHSGFQNNEAYFFYDKASSKIYVMSIDPKGYVWETSARVAKDKKRIMFIGSAKNVPGLSTQSVLNIENDNEVRFEQKVLQNGETISTYKGIWYRMPIEE